MVKTPNDLQALARPHSEAALSTLASIMMQDDAPPTVRVAAANAILERGYGKPLPPKDEGIDTRPLSELSMDELLVRLARVLEIAEQRVQRRIAARGAQADNKATPAAAGPGQGAPARPGGQ